jgi:hypothetical protein
MGEAVYGLPEFYSQQISQARLVANPGCYATSVILALKPLSDAGWIAEGSGVVCDCKSGATGAGKELRRDLQFSELDQNFRLRPFLIATRRKSAGHTGLPESQIVFSSPAAARAEFSPSTSTRESRSPRRSKRSFGSQPGRPMVRIWKAGTSELQHVAHSNFDIGFALTPWPPSGDGQLSGQSRQRRGRPGGTNHLIGLGANRTAMGRHQICGALEDKATVQSLAEQLAELAKQGHGNSVVHGGGRILPLKRLSRAFVAGLRVTDREARRGDGRAAQQETRPPSPQPVSPPSNFRSRCAMFLNRSYTTTSKAAGLRRLPHRREYRNAQLSGKKDATGSRLPGYRKRRLRKLPSHGRRLRRYLQAEHLVI